MQCDCENTSILPKQLVEEENIMNLTHRAESSQSYTGEHNLPLLKTYKEELHDKLAIESISTEKQLAE